MPYPASVIAYAFVKKGIEESNFLTQMKLQKVVYFAHGYHLAKFGTPLIKEQFQAWQYGPVAPTIYQKYKLYGSDFIKSVDLLNRVSDFQKYYLQLDANAIEAIDYTWETTKDLSASDLSNWTHLPDSPWDQAYIEGVNGILIDNKAIEDYFSTVLAVQE